MGSPRNDILKRGSGQQFISVLVGWIWLRVGPVLVYSVCSWLPCYGLLVARIWHTGPDHPSAIVPYGMWASLAI